MGGVLLGLALGFVAGIAIIVAGPVVAGLVGAIGLLIGVYQSLVLATTDLLEFSAARLLGTIAGIILSVILGGYVVISFSALFVIGFAWLLFTIARLFAVEIYGALSDARDHLHNRKTLV